MLMLILSVLFMLALATSILFIAPETFLGAVVHMVAIHVVFFVIALMVLFLW